MCAVSKIPKTKINFIFNYLETQCNFVFERFIFITIWVGWILNLLELVYM